MRDFGYPALTAPCLDAEDAPALASFWKEFLGLPYRRNQGPSQSPDFIVINGHGGEPKLAIQAVDALRRSTWPSNDVPAQAHLDLSVPDRAAQLRHVARAIELGAVVLDDRSDDDGDPLVVLADPAGHPFCLIAPPEGQGSNSATAA